MFLSSLLTCSPILQRLKNQSYALGEHDPGSAQDWRISSTLTEPRLISVSFQIRTSGKYHNQAGSTNRAPKDDDDDGDEMMTMTIKM